MNNNTLIYPSIKFFVLIVFQKEKEKKKKRVACLPDNTNTNTNSFAQLRFLPTPPHYETPLPRFAHFSSSSSCRCYDDRGRGRSTTSHGCCRLPQTATPAQGARLPSSRRSDSLPNPNPSFATNSRIAQISMLQFRSLC